MNLLNPKVFLFFTLFFPNFIYSETISFKFQILSLGLIFIVITFVVFYWFKQGLPIEILLRLEVLYYFLIQNEKKGQPKK